MEDLSDGWKCPECNAVEATRATRKICLQHTPDILLIQLKRFKQDSEGVFTRNDVLVDFPVSELDLSRFCGAPTNQSSDAVSCQDNNQKYDLSAVINHIDSKKHYTTLAKHADTGVWYEYNDGKCTSITTKDIMGHVGRQNAYILVYQRRGSYEARANKRKRKEDKHAKTGRKSQMMAMMMMLVCRRERHGR